MATGAALCDVMVGNAGAAGSSAQAEGTPSDDGGPQPNVWGALTSAEGRRWRVWEPQKGGACREAPASWTKQTPQEMPEALGLAAPAGQWLRSEVGSEDAWRDGMVTGAVAQVAQLQVDIGVKRGKCDHRDTEIRVLRMPSATQDHMCGVVAVAALFVALRGAGCALAMRLAERAFAEVQVAARSSVPLVEAAGVIVDLTVMHMVVATCFGKELAEGAAAVVQEQALRSKSLRMPWQVQQRLEAGEKVAIESNRNSVLDQLSS